jgi:dynein heavy chain 2
MKTVGKNGFVQIALGSGQTEGALIALRRCAEEGHWLCLKNLHLVTHWLGDFEKFFRALKPKPKFRLWLTTEPHPTFPSILLQQSLKVT